MAILRTQTRSQVVAANVSGIREVPEYMPVDGSFDAPVIVICDSPTIAMWRKGLPIDGKELSLWIEYAERYSFSQDDFAFVSPCAPVPDEVQGSEKRLREFAGQYSAALDATLARFTNKKLFIYTGKLAGQCLTKKPVKIMKQRGVVREAHALGAPILPMLSPNHCLRRPEVMDLFDADFNMFRIIADNEYIPATIADAAELATNYEWRTDISDILAHFEEELAAGKSVGISLDTETDNRANVPINERVSSVYWYRDEVVPITVQFAYQEGHAVVCPVDRDYWPDMTMRTYTRLVHQLKRLCEDERIKKFGHNCVPGDTEVLTPNGWVRFDAVCDHHEVMQYDKDTKELSFVVPNKVLRIPYKGKMYEWNTQFHQGCYTPDHRMLVAGVNRQYSFLRSSEVSTRGQNGLYVPVSGAYYGEGLDVPDDWLRFAEAVRADGSIGPSSVRFSLKRKRKIVRLYGIMQRAGVSFTTSVRADGVMRINVTKCPAKKFVLDLFAEGKRLGPWVLSLTYGQKSVWLDEAAYWDGSPTVGTGRTVSTADRQTADWLQIMADTTNSRYDVRERRNTRGFNTHNKNAKIYSASLRSTDEAKLVEKPVEQQFDGMVYCVTVPSSAFVVRRNGVAWITGNCKFDHHILRKLGINTKGWG